MLPYSQILPLTSSIDIYYPDSKYFIQRLKENKPFAFPRLTHGFWLALNGEHRDVMCMTGIHGMNIPDFIPEILDSLGALKYLPNLYLGIGLIDYSPKPEVLVTAHAAMYLRTLSAAIRRQGVTLYDGRLFKSMAISGEISVLPEICARTHTIAVGSSVFSSLGERWNLPKYTHVEIPLILASKSRYEILAQIEELLENAVEPPIVLFRAGSLAYWLIYNLSCKYQDVFYLDLGQVFNIWFLDQELDWWYWGTQYAPTIIKTCGLEDYYKRYLGDRYSEWYATLQTQKYTTLKKQRELLWTKAYPDT